MISAGNIENIIVIVNKHCFDDTSTKYEQMIDCPVRAAVALVNVNAATISANGSNLNLPQTLSYCCSGSG